MPDYEFKWVEWIAHWSTGPSHWNWAYLYLPTDSSIRDRLLPEMADDMQSYGGFRKMTWKFETPPDDYIQTVLDQNIKRCKGLLKMNRSMRKTLKKGNSGNE